MHAVYACCCQNELVRLESENETLLLDIEKLEKYLAGLTNRTSEKEANLHVLAEELQQRGTIVISVLQVHSSFYFVRGLYETQISMF